MVMGGGQKARATAPFSRRQESKEIRYRTPPSLDVHRRRVAASAGSSARFASARNAAPHRALFRRRAAQKSMAKTRTTSPNHGRLSGFESRRRPLLAPRDSGPVTCGVEPMFPRPSSISAATLNQYAIILKRLEATSRIRRPTANGVDIVLGIVDDLIDRAPTISRPTYRLYRAAVVYALRGVSERHGPGDRRRIALEDAIERLGATTPSQCIRRSHRTSANKAKRISDDDFESIRQHLLARAAHSPLADASAVAALIARLTGVRPLELCSFEAEFLTDGRVRLRVCNAKASNGRGLGSQRTIYLSELAADEREAFTRWPGLLAQLEPDGNPLRTLARIAKHFRRAARRALSPRRSYPSLYTLRHQFAADAKATGMNTDEVAALLGHASDITAQRHYGRRVSGTGGLRARPAPGDVAAVRLRATQFRAATPGAGPTA